MNAGIELRSLREQPFELLRELERRSQGAHAGQAVASGSGDFVGVALRSGEQLLLVPREEVREVMEFPSTTRVPGARAWVRGITNVRGRLVPVVDLQGFRGLDETRANRSCRLVIVNHRELPAAILVDEIMGFRRFAAEEFQPHAEGVAEQLAQFVLGQYRRSREAWPVISLVKLVESAEFADMAA